MRVRSISGVRHAARGLVKVQGLRYTDNPFGHLQDSTDGGILIASDNRRDGKQRKCGGIAVRFS
jgi:hypothetical protein